MFSHSEHGKHALLEDGQYEISSHAIVRKVLPRIIHDATNIYREWGLKTNHPQIRDVFALYFTLLHHTNGIEGGMRFGASWLSYTKFGKLLNIDPKKIRWLSSVLEANGLLITQLVQGESQRVKLYYPVFKANVSSDGYVVDADGQKIIPPNDVYLTEQQRKRKSGGKQLPNV